MFRKHVPDLDVLDSPLMSANPFGSTVGVVPGSALAERIFNDPEAWHGPEDDDDVDLSEAKDAMAWLAEEVEEYHANGDHLALSPVDRDVDIMLKPFAERFKLVPTAGSEGPAKWEGVLQDDKPTFLPLFEHKSLDLKFDLHLSKIWDSGGKMFGSASSPLSPASDRSAKLQSTLSSPIDRARLAAPPALDLAVESSLSPILSPVAVASASTTWSILEWYGSPPTPRMGVRPPMLGHFPPTPYQSIPPVPPLPHSSLRTPSSPSANATVGSQPPPLPQLPRNRTPPVSESTPIRRLPVIPDAALATPSPTPTPSSTPPRIKSPERTPRGSATLPPPSSSTSDPSFLSPNVTPIRSGTLPSRSPPAGPRPRSTSSQTLKRLASGRDSPTPITIAPAPAPNRPRRPTPPPTLRLGVPA
ncbi:hypothetical protein LshimejAT787_1202450 [Lyophyllum shimeji]|uniref:Uncharacterized protein n=1 Tax=Lyophyllum shimeji TaxID=47721 RepID=A0A9P3PX41_LYOSH|nr:hypothetical protein LshimejAT787_1202450 [Lyophyllum shimeji]